MSFPISPSAAIGAAGLAARAAAQVAKGSIEAVVDFADVLAQSEPIAASEALASDAGESLRTTITDLLRQFGINPEQPITIGLSDGRDQVQITSADGDDELASRLSELQTSINADDPLRSKIVQSLGQLPGNVYSIDASQ